MVGCRREDGREIQQVHAERHQVVELLGDAIEVSAVELLRAPRHDRVDRGVPARGDRPLRRRMRAGLRGAREAVGENLGHHGICQPRRRRRVGDEGEVLGVEGLERVQPGLVEPLHASVLVDEQPAVAVARIADRDGCLPPLPAVGRAEADGIRPFRLVIGIRPRADRGQRTVARRHSQSHGDDVAERRREIRHVQRRAVVVRKKGCHALAFHGTGGSAAGCDVVARPKP